MKQRIIFKINAILKEKFNSTGFVDSRKSFFEMTLNRNAKVIYENAEITRLAKMSKFIGTVKKSPLISKLKTENAKTNAINIESIIFILLLN